MKLIVYVGESVLQRASVRERDGAGHPAHDAAIEPVAVGAPVAVVRDRNKLGVGLRQDMDAAAHVAHGFDGPQLQRGADGRRRSTVRLEHASAPPTMIIR